MTKFILFALSEESIENLASEEGLTIEDGVVKLSIALDSGDSFTIEGQVFNASNPADVAIFERAALSVEDNEYTGSEE